MVNLETRPSWSASGLQISTFSKQELTADSSVPSTNGSADHGADAHLSEAHSLLLEPDVDIHNVKKSFVFITQNNNECMETVCLHNPAHLDTSLLASDQVHEAGTVSTSTPSNDNTSPSVPLRSEQEIQSNAGQTAEDLNCGCAKPDVERIQLVTNGHDGPETIRPAEPNTILSPDSGSTFTDPVVVPNPSQRTLELPRIIKHKPSSITFSNNTCLVQADVHASVNDSSDDADSSPGEENEDQDDGDDDDEDDDEGGVFPGLPKSRDVFGNYRQRTKEKRRGSGCARAEPDPEAEGESNSKEVICQLFTLTPNCLLKQITAQSTSETDLKHKQSLILLR